MTKLKTIHWRQLPSNWPIQTTLLGYLLMEHFHANQLAWGIFITIFVLLWISKFVTFIFLEDRRYVVFENEEKT